MSKQSFTACTVIIGNEILSGRTQDANLQFIAKKLEEKGITLAEVRVIPDLSDVIVRTINEVRSLYTYVFTTGGIGPTHDDITMGSIAKALGIPLIQHPQAFKVLDDYYKSVGQSFSGSRQRMSLVPKGSNLINNKISKAPGAHIRNIFIMAGVPLIMQSQFMEVLQVLNGGNRVLSKTVTCYLRESEIAIKLEEVQNHNPTVQIGSYPFYTVGKYGTSLVIRGESKEALEKVAENIRLMIESCGGEWVDGELC